MLMTTGTHLSHQASPRLKLWILKPKPSDPNPNPKFHEKLILKTL